MTTAAATATEPDHDIQHDQPREPAREHEQAPRRVPATLLVALAGDAPQWQDRALCAQTDPEAFFPEKGGSTREAKQICTGCEVRAECLEDALGQDERFGIWGGLSERERRRLKRSAGLPVAEPRGLPEPRATPERGRRESAPAPGGGRHAGGTGLATTLPTEPRHRRGRPVQARARSTFPDRARHASSAPAQPDSTTHRRPLPATAATGPATRTARTRTTRCARAAEDSPALASELALAATAAAAAPGRGDDQDDVAAPGTAPRRPPDPPRSASPGTDPVLQRAIADVLAGQPQAPELDPTAIAALADRSLAAEPENAGPDSMGEWQVRVAAVAVVISGHATRGQTARRFGLPTQTVAHWVARHQQRMPLLEPTEGSPR